MEKSTKILLGLTVLTAIVAVTTVVIVCKDRKKEEEEEAKSGVAGTARTGSGRHHHRPGHGQVGIRNIYGGSYIFPYTPLYGYDQCTYTDKNGLLIAAPCPQSMGWSRSW